MKYQLFLLMFLVWSPIVKSDVQSDGLSVVFVESVVEDNVFSGRRIAYISSDKDKPSTLVELSEPVELVQCNEGRISYINANGELWQIDIKEKVPRKLMRFASAKGELFNKILWLDNGKKLSIAQNNSPDPSEDNDTFSLVSYSIDGRVETIATSKGNVRTLWQPESGLVELVTKNRLIQVDLSTNNMSIVTPFDTKDIPSVKIIKDGYSVYNSGRGIKVRKGVFGSTVMRREIDDGFFVVTDFNSKQEKILVLVVGSGDSTKDRLAEININTNKSQELFRSESIGSACYLKQ